MAPSDDAARRIERHFPQVRVATIPWEDDAPSLPLARFADPRPAPLALLPDLPGRVRICVIGGIGVEKGYAILHDCLRDARARALTLDFVVVGHTQDDDALFEAGCLEITGAYREAEAVELIRAQRCDLCFLPSIWPGNLVFHLDDGLARGPRCGGLRHWCAGGKGPAQRPRRAVAARTRHHGTQ